MHQLTIDCSGIVDALQLHAAFARTLDFPEWYGRNLDALYDCLTTIHQDTCLCLQNFESLDNWKKGFRCVLEDACLANPMLHLIWEN